MLPGFRQPVFLIPYPPVSSAGFVFLPSVFSALFHIPLIYPLNMLLFICSAPSVCRLSFRLFYLPLMSEFNPQPVYFHFVIQDFYDFTLYIAGTGIHGIFYRRY